MKLYKRISLLLSMGIMGIGLITFRFSPVAEAKVFIQSSDTYGDTENTYDGTAEAGTAQDLTSAPTSVPTPTTAPTPTPEPNLLTKVTSGEIYDLIVAYLNAKLTCNAEAFADIVTDINFIDEADLLHRTEMICGYSDIVCYTKRGAGIIDYIVYYTYTMDITTIDSQAVSIEEMYITTDADGRYRIFLGYLDKETKDALLALDEDEDVVTLVSEVYDTMSAEIEADEDLLAFWIRLYENAEDEEFVLPDESETTEEYNAENTGSEG